MNKEKKLEILVKSHQQHFKLFFKEVHHNNLWILIFIFWLTRTNI